MINPFNYSIMKGFWEGWPDSYKPLYDYIIDNTEDDTSEELYALKEMEGKKPKYQRAEGPGYYYFIGRPKCMYTPEEIPLLMLRTPIYPDNPTFGPIRLGREDCLHSTWVLLVVLLKEPIPEV